MSFYNYVAVEQFNGCEGETATLLSTSPFNFCGLGSLFPPTSSQSLGCFALFAEQMQSSGTLLNFFLWRNYNAMALSCRSYLWHGSSALAVYSFSDSSRLGYTHILWATFPKPRFRLLRNGRYSIVVGVVAFCILWRATARNEQLVALCCL